MHEPPPPASSENVPAGFKLLAWEGVGLYVPQRWEIGRHEGDHGRGVFRVDDASRVVVQARWWTAARPVPIDDLVREHVRTVHGRLDSPPRFARAEWPGLAPPAGDRLLAFEADIQHMEAPAGRELLVIWQRPSNARMLMLRFLIERGRPDRDCIRAMLAGLRLQGADAPRDFAALDFAVHCPPGYRLQKGVLKAGICYLEFRAGRRRLALRRFSAADAVMQTETPDVAALERWCRRTYATEFHDMRYAVERLADPLGRPMLRLTGKRRVLAPIEIQWLMPRHRRLPRRMDIVWDAAANKIYCVELRRPNPAMEPDVVAFESALQMTLVPEAPERRSKPDKGVPENADESRQARLRSLRARVHRLPGVMDGIAENGCPTIRYTVERPRRLRLLRLLGGLPAGSERQPRTLELDLIGALVWQAGGRGCRVCEIVDRVRERFRISHREAELSVTEFIRALGTRGVLSVELDAG